MPYLLFHATQPSGRVAQPAGGKLLRAFMSTESKVTDLDDWREPLLVGGSGEVACIFGAAVAGRSGGRWIGLSWKWP